MADRAASGRDARDTAETPRRRRRGTAFGDTRKLGVREELLDFDRFSYRWINDADNRIYDKTKQDDWDIVQNDGGVKEDSADLGNAVTQIVGTKKDGSPLRAYLCRKPKGYFDSDQKDKLAELDKQLSALRMGSSAEGKPLDTDEYVPTSGIRL